MGFWIYGLFFKGFSYLVIIFENSIACGSIGWNGKGITSKLISIRLES